HPSTTDRIVSKTVTYWLYRLAGGRMDLFRSVHLGLHVVTPLALFFLVRHLTRMAPVGDGFRPALAVALLFTLHPLPVYAVGDPGPLELVLATLFGLLALLAYLGALEQWSPRLLVLSLLAYVLAVLSKENLIALPALAAALTLLVRPPSWALVRRLWPWYLV